jgi:hypothetical protein
MNNQITLALFVKKECCNLVSGVCLGLNGNNKKFRNQGTCYITERKSCPYFTRVLLPLGKLKGCYNKIISGYQNIDLAIRREKVRQCECGTALSRGKKYCDKCRKKRRLQTNKENLRKHRGSM